MFFMRILNFILNLFCWKSVYKALVDTIVIFLFTTLATSASIISFLVKSEEIINWETIYNTGNFFLYSISLLSSSYLYYQHKRDKLLGKSIVIILITFCALIYSQFINDQKSSTTFTINSSITLIIISSIVFFITQYYQHFEIIDPNEEDRNNQNAIAQGVIF